MSRILAIDYGSRRVGLAVTDPQQRIASPLETVGAKDLITYLTKYFTQEDVEQVVVGYPLRVDGNPTHATPLVDKLLLQLAKHFPDLSITTYDERYTSKIAQRSLFESGAKKKNRQKKSNLDAISATLILQSFLEDITLSP